MAKSPHQATASAPACVGNVAVGFDFLGHTILGPQDQATVRRIPDPRADLGNSWNYT